MTQIKDLTEKTSVVDDDVFAIDDSEASNITKKVKVSRIKTYLKTYLDTLYVALTGDQTVAGVKTFSSFPVTPSSAPTTDYQVANKKYVDDNAGGGGTNQNDIINPEFAVAQRGTTFDASTLVTNSDGNYTFDRWVLLSDSNDIVDLTQLTSGLPTGIHRGMKATVQTINKQFGFLQILSAANSAKYLSDNASLRFYAKMGAADDNTHSLKANVLAWNGTADSPTKDVVSAWGATVTLATNWTAENTAASNTLTTSWQEFTIEGVSVDTSGMTNIAVFIYCDQTDGALADEIYLTQVKLENSATCTDYIAPIYEREKMACRYYYWNTFDFGLGSITGQAISTTNVVIGLFFPEMRTMPTVDAYLTNPVSLLTVNASSANNINIALTAISVGGTQTVNSVRLTATVASGLVAGNASYIKSLSVSYDAEIGV